jgi:hypothetical protein
MKNSIFPFFILLITSHLSGQGFSLTGMVMDSIETAVLPGAHVTVMRMRDSTLTSTVTEDSGKFRFDNLRQGGYELRVTYLGYQNYQRRVFIRNQDTDAGLVRLVQASQFLEQVQVVEQVLPATQIGDTTQFNAGAFKVNPDANAEELIRKMPGVTVEGGKVQAQGEDIKEVLVDGKPFFGNDPTAALRNLPAEVIDKIQVFDRQSDQAQFTGFADGETSKTINIITRSNMRNGQFGKVYGGYGTDERYYAGGNLNFFKGDARVSVIGLSNNINQQNFSTDDLLGVVGSQQSGRGGPGGGRGGGFGGGPGGGRMRPGGDTRDFLVGQQSGISTTNAFGLNYSDQWGAKWQVSGSYFFNVSDNNSIQNLSQEYFTSSDFTQFYNEDSRSSSQNMNHRLNMRLEYTIDSSNSIIIQPRLSFQRNDGIRTNFGQSILGGLTASETDYRFNADLTGLDMSNNILYRHRFAKRGRTFSINLNTGYNRNNGENFLLSENIFFSNQTFSDTLDQTANLFADGWSVSSFASYTEPLGEKSQLQFNYSVSYQFSDSEKETYDFAESTQNYTDLNPVLSNTFKSNYLAQEAGLGYRLNGEKYMLNARLSYQRAQLDNEQVFPFEDQLDRSFSNLLPTAFFRYEFSRQQNLRIVYRARTSPPSISQLQDVLDNSNPLQLRTGNPDLLQNYQHNLFFRYSNTNTEKSSSFFAMLGGGVTDNYVANSTFIAQRDTVFAGGIVVPQGAQLTRPVNLDGYWNVRSFITYGVPVRALRSNFNFNLSANYARQPGQINNRINYADNSTFGVGLVLSSNFSEKLDFTLASRTNYNMVRNTLNTDRNDEFVNQNTEVGVNWIFGPGFVFRTSMNHQLYSGLSEGFDQNFWLWNAAVAKKFLKGQRGELQLSVFDLLKQNTSVQRNITEAFIEDIQTQVLQQYFMLTFTYQLRNFGTGK